MRVEKFFTTRLALPALALAALLIAPVQAPAAAAPDNVLDPAAAAGFWSPQRVGVALANGSPGEPGPADSVAPSAVLAGTSSLKVVEAASIKDRTNGRIFGRDPKEGLYSCSGTSLETPSGSVVLTAGHCVLQAGSWGTHLVFVPAFDHENRPFGTFAATAVYVPRQWRRFGNPDFDVAALRVEPNQLGALTAAVGARGYVTGKSRFAPQQILGYPAGALEGQELRSCPARGLGSDRLSNFFPGPPTMPARCDMAGGSSGGAWLLEGKLIDGVTSYGYPSRAGRLYSPYFGPEIGNFLDRLP